MTPSLKNIEQALLTLSSIPLGMNHYASATTGAWVFIGREIPESFHWSGLPVASSISLVWSEGGGCSLSHQGEEITLSTDQFMWIDDGYPHQGVGMKGSSFLTLFLPKWVDQTKLFPMAWGGELKLSVWLELVCFAAEVVQGKACEASMSRLEEVLQALVHRTRPVALPAVPRCLKRAKEVLDERTPQDLASLADTSGWSVHHFAHQFSEAWGISAIQYRKQLRLSEATKLLASGASVTEAASEAGFSDTAHLSREFRRQYGISPSAWKAKVGVALHV